MKEYLRSFGLFSEEEIEEAFRLTTVQTLKKGDFFIREGAVCRKVAFVESGVFRSFYRSKEEEEITYCFTFPNRFLTAYSSFITEKATPENIEALTPSRLRTISKETIGCLADGRANWTQFLRFMAEQEYLELEKRVFLLQKEKAVTRYHDLLDNQPEYIQQIPLQYLASYLGVTPRHLSRLRKGLFH